MKIYDIIRKKRDQEKLSSEEIKFWIDGYVKGEIADYQVSALLMAIFLNGLDHEETVCLTDAMMHSGQVMDLSDLDGIKADKHSTGGVGDKTSLIVTPIMAAAGLKVAKMSGRGLGHTGGTVDKLESISGFNIALSGKEFKQQVKDIGIAIIGQTAELVPADKLLYALRDVTATVDSLPLIASSIMSKKLAMGADLITLDVKYGSGAFMKDLQSAKELAGTMVDIGTALGKKTAAVITSMDAPLGCAIGNALEIQEVLAVLQGKGPADLRQVSLYLAAESIYLAGIKNSMAAALQYSEAILNDGRAYQKFIDFIVAQGGQKEQLVNSHLLPQAPCVHAVYSNSDGYISNINAEAIGFLVLELGGGRKLKTDVIDYSVGVVLTAKPGDFVHTNQCLAYIHSKNEADFLIAQTGFLQAVTITAEQPVLPQLIAEIVELI